MRNAMSVFAMMVLFSLPAAAYTEASGAGLSDEEVSGAGEPEDSGWSLERVSRAIRVGGDIRIRYDMNDNWPRGEGVAPGSVYEEYLRVRTRIWSEFDLPGGLLFRIRAGNEFRRYSNSPENSGRFDFPDVLFFDNLYLNWDGGGDWSVRIGRQDIVKGAPRIIADGTPGDGSRTSYFDGIVVTRRFAEKSSVDFMGTWNHYRDELAVGSTDIGVYDMNFMRRGDPYSRMDEGMLAVYAECREINDLGFDAYLIWKKETSYRDGSELRPGRDFSTAGCRILPEFSDWLSGEFECALQFGRVDSKQDMKSRDILAGMLYAGLTARAAGSPGAPSLRIAALFLSGDSDSYNGTADGSRDSGWNPVFGRFPPSSEILIYMYDVARWSNLFYPHVEIGADTLPGHRLSLETGPMYAVEKDCGANGRFRGLFARLVYRFPLPDFCGVKLSGYVAGDLFEYGGYYDTAEDRATSIRFEVNAAF